MITYDEQTVDAAGAFLVGELERLDPRLYQPLVSVTWHRDIDLRPDVTLGDEASSFVLTDFAAAGGARPNGKNWISDTTTEIGGLSVKNEKKSRPLHPWGMQVAYSVFELARSQQINRPIDEQKHQGLRLKHNMDVDEQVYIGDEEKGCTGLVNNAVVSPLGLSATWDTLGPEDILADINELIAATWAQSGYAQCPTQLLLPPLKYGLLTVPVTSAGSKSILQYVAESCLSANTNGRPLEIHPLKWLSGRGGSGSDRAVAYTRDPQYVRFPMVPLQRTPLEYRGAHQIVTYYGTMGEVEFVYPETVGYADGL